MLKTSPNNQLAGYASGHSVLMRGARGASDYVGQWIAITAMVFALSIHSMQVHARPLPPQAMQLTPLEQVGEGRMSWFGFTLYRASLWTSTGSFQNLRDSVPVALHIVYDKNIRGEKLVETTVEEWERLRFFDDRGRAYWAEQLRTIWPDVKPGDSITTLIQADRTTVFFANDKRVGRIQDPGFGYALLSIWLHPDTIAPELRSQLIGRKEG
jgi:hypothetical protein